jgi:hypothetical protein
MYSSTEQECFLYSSRGIAGLHGFRNDWQPWIFHSFTECLAETGNVAVVLVGPVRFLSDVGLLSIRDSNE